MARIDSYTVTPPTVDDYLLGTDSPSGGGPTRNFTVQSIIDLTSESLGNTNDYLDAITVEAGYAADAADTATITFSVSDQSDVTLDLGGAAFKAADHYATSASLTDHLNDTTQPHSLDSIVGSGTITPAKLSGNPGNGTLGQILVSDGAGGFSWGNDQDDNDNYYLSSITRPDANSTDLLFTITGGTDVTATIFNEGAFLSKADIRSDIKNNVSFEATDLSFLGDLASKDKITTVDITESSITTSKIKDNSITEGKLKITNDAVAGYVLTAGATAGDMAWVQNSASNYYLDGITRGGTNNKTLTFSINGGTNQTYTFGDGAFAAFGTGGDDVARGSHKHSITEITNAGALASLDQVTSSEIANNAVTAAKLQPATVGSTGQVLSVDSSGNLEWISVSGAIDSIRLLPGTIGTEGQITRVNSGATAVEYLDLSVAKTELDTTNSPSAGKILALDQNNDMYWAENGASTIEDNAVTYAKLANEFTTKDTKITLSSSNIEADIDFEQHAVFEIDLPSDSTNITLNFDKARIGETKVVIINGKGGSGTITFDTNDLFVSGNATVFKRLSLDEIDKTNATVNYIQITCVNTTIYGKDFIYTVGTAQ